MAEGYEPRFDIDYEVGRQGELWVASIRDALRTERAEVKTDVRASVTGNVYVEYECRHRGKWKPSGIATNESPVYVFVLAARSLALVVDTEALKREARRAYNAGRLAECKKGSHPTRGVLIPVQKLVADLLHSAQKEAA